MKIKIEKPNEIIFLGYHDVLKSYVKINKSFKIKSTILLSKNQFNKIKSNKEKIKFFSNQGKKFISELKKITQKPTKKIFISVSWPWILGKNIINAFFEKNLLLNIHHSRLPYDAGRATTSWKILRNDRINSTIVHKIDKKVDSGAIIYRKDTLFSFKAKTPNQYDTEINNQSISMYKEFLNKIYNNSFFKIKHQPDFIGRYNMRLNTKLNAWIDWNWSSEHLIRFINAFDEPYEGAKTSIDGKIVRLKKAQLHGGETVNHPFASGQVLRNDKKWILVATSDHNCLIIEKILDNNDHNIILKIKQGSKFHTSYKNINLSKTKAKLTL